MKNKGFTLIELLAVIVILAIIAIIATPIILNIINDTKESADKRSVELYGKAIENAVGNYQVKHPEDTDITFAKVQEYIKYKGNEVVCDPTKTKINKDGTVYLSGCKVDGKDVKYTYGEDKPVSFANDTWATIVSNVKKGNTSAYKVGDTKEVNLGEELGVHTLRIANTSTPDECNTEGFSQTACGFVIEFADIITTHNMNPLNSTDEGVWIDSSMRAYVNGTIYNSLPQEIKDNIIDTYEVSGYGTDKLYLLSTKEVYGSNPEYDTATNETRQLDYYKNNGVTTSSYSIAIKKRNGNAAHWWLRSANPLIAYSFSTVAINGDWYYNDANNTYGVSPAFRIG